MPGLQAARELVCHWRKEDGVCLLCSRPELRDFLHLQLDFQLEHEV